MTQPILNYLSCINTFDRANLLKTLSSWGFAVVVFDGETVTTARELMEQVGQQFGLHETMHPRSWDGFRDALFEIMTTADSEEVALIWDHSDHMVANDLQDFLKAATILHDVAVATRRAQNINSYFFLLGKQPGYRHLTTILIED